METSTKRRVAIYPVVVALMMLMAFALAPGAAAKPPPAATCALNPGDTVVTWKSYAKTTSIDIEWFDGAGTMIASVTISPTKAMHATYSQQTPVGTAEFGVRFHDASGVFGVTGGECF